MKTFLNFFPSPSGSKCSADNSNSNTKSSILDRENKNNKFFKNQAKKKAKMMQNECYVYIKTILIDWKSVIRTVPCAVVGANVREAMRIG